MVRDFAGFLFAGLLFCSLVPVGCTLQDFKAGLFSVSSCGFHSSMGCAGQAIGACHPEFQEEDAQGFAICITEKSQGCIVKSFSRCALAGAVKAVGSVIVGGGTGCGTDAHRAEALRCVVNRSAFTEAQAVQAASACWMEACGF